MKITKVVTESRRYLIEFDTSQGKKYIDKYNAAKYLLTSDIDAAATSLSIFGATILAKTCKEIYGYNYSIISMEYMIAYKTVNKM